jgi:hypothetical protein
LEKLLAEMISDVLHMGNESEYLICSLLEWGKIFEFDESFADEKNFDQLKIPQSPIEDELIVT